MARPKGTTPPKETAAVRLGGSDLSKVKYIAWYGRDTLTDVVERALITEIAKFEKKNGTITDAQIAESQKKKSK